MVLSLTPNRGSNVKYLIKSPQADALEAARKDGMSKEKVSWWDMSQLRTYRIAWRCDFPRSGSYPVAAVISIVATADRLIDKSPTETEWSLNRVDKLPRRV